jgi:benzoylsuccinyl-CoA thiolase BbsB subunit
MSLAPAYVIGASMVRFGKHPDVTQSVLGAHAAIGALQDAQISEAEVEAAFVGSQWGGSMVGQRILKQTTMLGMPITNVENACSSGSTALRLARIMVGAGLHDVVLAIGVDKLSAQAGPLPRHPEDFDGSLGLSPPALYAMRARRYMHDHGATEADLASVCVKNRGHAVDNPYAQFRAETSIDEVLGSRMIADPLTLLQCCARADGAAAVVVASETVARRSRDRQPIRILASAQCSGKYMPGYRDMTVPEITERCAAKAYAEAAIGPGDLDFAEVHDAFSIAELLYYEALGLCKRGEGVRLIRDGSTAIGGRIPVNVSGGLIAKGHPPGATGIAQVFEAVQQLRGMAGSRQVSGARLGLTHCTGGGVSGLDHGACTIHVLAPA